MSTALMVRNDAQLSASFTEEADRIKSEALEVAVLVGRVTNAAEQEKAVAAQQALAHVLGQIEKARVFAKAPIIDYGRAIDTKAKEYTQDLLDEANRLGKLVGDYQALELAKARAAQAAENKRLEDLERERQRQASQAQTHEELEKVHARFDEQTRTESLTRTVPKAKGQVVTEDWDFEVEDPWALARFCIASGHTECVNIEPRRTEIKALLNVGTKIPGIKAQRVTRAGVRATPQRTLNV